ncbi:MAG: polysaccharide biosynthesis C-terminal domain-containing protein [Clostridia bacterium]|nr:polysaccharide biosynthesis C-terminal domain-containing protein [Clostridia bacterium]
MRRTTFNMLSSVFYRVAVILTGLIAQRYILTEFGSAINGVTSSISRLISYLSLLEAGIGAATVQALQKPLCEGDRASISAIFAAGKRMYLRAGLVFFLFLAVISGVLPVITHDEISPLTVALLTLVSGASNVTAYIFIGKFTSLMLADSRGGAVYLIDSAFVLLSCALRVVMVHAGAGIVAVQSVHLLCTALRAIAVYMYAKKVYPWLNRKASPDMSAAPKRRSAMTHQIAGLVVNHTDVTILTVFSSLKTVSLYSVYAYIYSALQTLFETVFHQALLGNFGRAAAQGKEHFNRKFILFQTAYNTVLYYILTLTLCLTLPFISFYTEGVTDIKYIDPWLAALFCLALFMNLIRLPSISAVTAYGYFKETERSALIECAVNLAVSFALFPFFGIYGLLIGTVAAYIFRTQDSIRFVYRRCGIQYTSFIRSNAGNLVASALVITFTFGLFPITVTSVRGWLIAAVALAAATAPIFIAACFVSDRATATKLLRTLKRHGNSPEKE